jgi:hypothetical protein
MAKEIINILYNPGSMSTSGTGRNMYSQENLAHTTTYAKGSQIDLQMLESLEKLVQSSNEQEIVISLLEFKGSLVLGASIEMRPTILREFNNYLSHVYHNHKNSLTIFQQSLEVILEFKAQIDNLEQPRGYVSQSEWIELERAVYCLSVWEDQNQSFSMHAL